MTLNLDINNSFKKDLFEKGHTQLFYPLSKDIKTLVKEQNWAKLYQIFNSLMSESGSLRLLLLQFHKFDSFELMLAVRDSSVEEGIWHDDGSRSFAFTLSLTLDHLNIEGGNLLFRKKGEKSALTELPTQEFGTLTLFLTGQYGYEHKVSAIKSGKRVVLVGWCH
jgi:hypothetical protein